MVRTMMRRAALAAALSAVVAAVVAAGPVEAQTAATGTIEGAVTSGDDGVAGVVVDLFAQAADGSRGAWLGDATTDDTGRYRFTPDAGCYVLTVIAPANRQLTNGQQWLNTAACVEAGGAVTVPDAPLAAGDAVAASGTVTRAGQPAAGVAVDLFSAASDGTRATWLSQTVTGADGVYAFPVTAGCYVATVIAPDGEQFVPGGSGWRNLPFCVGGADVTGLDAALRGAATQTLTLSIGDGSRALPDIAVDLFTADGGGQRLTWVTTERSAADGTVSFDVTDGCWAVTAIAPGTTFWPATGTPWLTRSTCVSGGASADLGQIVGTGGSEIHRTDVYARLERRTGVVSPQPVDLYEANTDGTRGRLLGSWLTSVGLDDVTFAIDAPAPACYVLVFSAPPGETFQESGTATLDTALCTDPAVNQFRATAFLADIAPDVETVDLSAGSRTLDLQLLANNSSIAYRFAGDGDQIGLYLLGEIGGADCSPLRPGASLSVSVGGQFLRSVDQPCGIVGPLTVPAGGDVRIQAQLLAGSTSTGLRVLVGRYDTLQTASGTVVDGPAVRIDETLGLFGGRDLVFTGEPGELVTARFTSTPGPGLSCMASVELAVAGSPYQRVEPLADEGCGYYGPWPIPGSGRLVVSARSIAGYPQAASLRLALELRQFTPDARTVTLPGTATISRTIRFPFDGTALTVNGEPGSTVLLDVTALSTSPFPCSSQLTPLRAWDLDRPTAPLLRLDACTGYPVTVPGSGQLRLFLTSIPGFPDANGLYSLTVRPGA